MSPQLTVIVFDRDERQLARRVDRVQSECAAREDRSGFRIIDANRRCQLLREAERASNGVAFIDLRDDDRDIQARGFGAIETIRRHTVLSRRCRPIAWTAWSSHATAQWARQTGAYALLDDDLVFRGAGSVLDLAIRVAQQPAAPLYERVAFEYRTFSRATKDEEEAARRERQERLLGESWRPGDEELLPRMARGEGFRAIHRTLRRRQGLEALRKRFHVLTKAAREATLGHDRGQVSIQALEAFGQPPRAPAPTPLTDRPDPLDAARWWRDEDVRRCAYNAEDEIAAVDEYARNAIDVVAALRKRNTGRWSEEDVIERETRLTEQVANRLEVGVDEANLILYRGLRNLHAAAIDIAETRGERV